MEQIAEKFNAEKIEIVTYDKRTGLCHVKSKTNKIDNITKT